MKTTFNFQVRAGFKPAPYCLLLLALLLLLPLAAFAQPDLTVCAGQGFMITSKADAQSISGGVTYTWHVSVNDGSYTVVDGQTAASLPVPDGQSEAGTYAYVRYAASDACPGGVPTKPYTVVVLAPVAPTVSASASCVVQGATLQFTASGYTGTLQWTSYTDGDVTESGASVTYSTSAAAGTKTVTARSYNSGSGTTCYSAPVSASAEVVAGGTDGQPVTTCGCAPGHSDCSGTCLTTRTYADTLGSCKKQGVRFTRRLNQCGTVLSWYDGSATDASCLSNCPTLLTDAEVLTSKLYSYTMYVSQVCNHSGERWVTCGELRCLQADNKLDQGINGRIWCNSSGRYAQLRNGTESCCATTGKFGSGTTARPLCVTQE